MGFENVKILATMSDSINTFILYSAFSFDTGPMLRPLPSFVLRGPKRSGM